MQGKYVYHYTFIQKLLILLFYAVINIIPLIIVQMLVIPFIVLPVCWVIKVFTNNDIAKTAYGILLIIEIIVVYILIMSIYFNRLFMNYNYFYVDSHNFVIYRNYEEHVIPKQNIIMIDVEKDYVEVKHKGSIASNQLYYIGRQSRMIKTAKQYGYPVYEILS